MDKRLSRLFLLATFMGLAVAGCSGPSVDEADDVAQARSFAPLRAEVPAPVELFSPPITAPPNTWTWINFPDAVCDDGTPTGLGVNLVPGSQDLLIFLMGGGACWDYASCAVTNTSTHGPYGSAQFDATKPLFHIGSLLDRKAATPYKGYNMVFVPYCTGDVFMGDNVVTYDNGAGASRVIHHKGRPNLVAYLNRLAATFPALRTLVVSGSSAGGFGAALNYDLARTYFSHAQSSLIDDSGPPLIGDGIPKDLRDTWYKSWRLDKTLAPLCPDCQKDFATLLPILARKYPRDRMALLSHNQDGVIRGFFGNQSATTFETNLYAMAATAIDPLPNFHYYFAAGSSHTFLFTPAFTVVKGVSLLSWLTQLGKNDPKWTSVKP